MTLAAIFHMSIARQMTQYARGRLTRRLYRSMPWIGSVVAVATIGSAIRQKGWLGGTLDTTLDFIPFVGGAKNFAEAVRGRDFIKDKGAVSRPANASDQAPRFAGDRRASDRRDTP
jgi:putative toxin of predicted polymorphic toxin system